MQAGRRVNRRGGETACAAGVNIGQADELRRGLGPNGAGADGDGGLALHSHFDKAAQAIGHHIAHIHHLHAVGYVEVDVPADAGGRAVARHHLDDHTELVADL